MHTTATKEWSPPPSDQIVNAASLEKARAIYRRSPAAWRRSPKGKVSTLLTDAEDDLIAFYMMPAEHWTKLRSTSPLERVNWEIARRSGVIGIYLNDAALIRLAASLSVEQNDEWLVGRRYMTEASMALVLGPDTHTELQPGELPADIA